MTERLKNITIGLFFISVIVGAVYWGNLKAQKEIVRPPGWQIIRPPHDVYCLLFDGDIVWAGGRDGVVSVDRKTGETVKKLPDDAVFSYVRGLHVDKSATLWIAHNKGLTTYDGKIFFTHNTTNGFPDNRVNMIMEDSRGRVWVGTQAGVAVREGERWRVLTKEDGLLDNNVNVILEDNDGGMWFGSYAAPAGGLSYLKDGNWQYFSTGNGLPHNNVSTLFQDRDGFVWVGTGLFKRGGAAQLKKTLDGWQIHKTLSKRDGLAGEKARSIFQDKDGMFWFGSEYSGLAFFDKGKKRVITDKDGLSDPEVKMIKQDTDGDVWLATHNGLTLIKYPYLSHLLP